MEIRENVAIVTGGASGLGEACARMVVEHGGYVGVLDLDQAKGYALSDELGDNAHFFETDVTDSDNVKQVIDSVCRYFGKLNFVINCAGINKPMKVLSKKGPMPLDDFHKVIQVNLAGTMSVIALATERIVTNTADKNGEKGVVVNTASIAAFEGQVGQAAYSASKAGIIGLTLPIAREFADYGIRVAAVAPGLFETPMLSQLPDSARASLISQIPFPKRLGRPSEFAALVRHILENPLINGETIRLDSAIRMGSS